MHVVLVVLLRAVAFPGDTADIDRTVANVLIERDLVIFREAWVLGFAEAG
jgi:hypothetical protein